jgi:small subunit ribosomal protein S20
VRWRSGNDWELTTETARETIAGYARDIPADPAAQERPLANSAQARKRARQAETHRQRNAAQRSTYRTAIKKVLKAIRAGDKSAATEAYQTAVRIIDRSAGKGLMHANKAARHKSRLNGHIKAMS